MTATSFRLSTPETIPTSRRRILDFDLETVAAGYADPQWVPSTVTAWAASWIDEDDVACGLLPVAHLYDEGERRNFIRPLLELIEKAGILTGHNIIRFDLVVLSAEVMRLGLPGLKPTLVQDTIRLPKSKGFKKGLDNLGTLLHVPTEKLPLNWQAWSDAYSEPDMATVRDRVTSDVVMHKQVREEMRKRGWLSPPQMWRP